MRYTTKTTEVNAIQYTGENFQDVIKFGEGKVIMGYTKEGLSLQFAKVLVGNPVIEKGNFLVWINGKLNKLEAKDFFLTFKKVEKTKEESTNPKIEAILDRTRKLMEENEDYIPMVEQILGRTEMFKKPFFEKAEKKVEKKVEKKKETPKTEEQIVEELSKKFENVFEGLSSGEIPVELKNIRIATEKELKEVANVIGSLFKDITKKK